MVTQGNLERFMPPFASLSDRQRWDVVAYALSLRASPTLVEQGADLYQAKCSSCHGDKGQGDGPQAAELSVKPTDFTSQELMAQKSAAELFQAISQGAAPAMPAWRKSRRAIGSGSRRERPAAPDTGVVVMRPSIR
jgi:mono/diheme cytochrome c family protein